MTDTQIGDETLEEWFAAAAAEYEVPQGALDSILAAAGETAAPKVARFQHPRLAAAAVLVIAAVGGAAIWSSVGHSGRGSAPSATERSPAHGAATSSAGQADRAFVLGAPAAAGAPEPNPLRGTSEKTVNGPSVQYQSSHGTMPLNGAKAPAAATGVDGAKIVHTGSLGLIVAKGQVGPVLTKLDGLASGFNGYVASSTTAESGSRPTGTVVLRVPAESFDAALAQARTYGKVSSTSSSAKDVTATYTDLKAQINALTKTRDHYLTLLASAKTVPETLAVQQRIDNAQLQMDQLQGQLNVLSSQAAYGTLSVTVSQKAAVVPPKPAKPQSGLSKAWHSAKDGFITGVEALIAHSGRALVVLLVLLAGLGILRAGWRIGRRRMV